MEAPFLFTVDSYSFALGWDERSKALDIARYLFLREEGEKLKAAYFRYLDVFKLGGQDTAELAQRSWRTLDRKLWPDASSVSEIQAGVSGAAVPRELSVYVVKEAYDGLRRAVSNVAYVSAMAMFEGKEYLLKRVLREADDVINRLGVELVRFKSDAEQGKPCDFVPIETPVKAVAISTGDLLKALCRLADEVTIQ